MTTQTFLPPPRTGAVSCLSASGFHTVRFTDWGAIDNPRVVVCVHGLTRNARDFDRLAAALAGDFRVICPDIVGRGQSDWLRSAGGYQYPQYGQDMATLLATLSTQGMRSLYWVGTSMGGLIGLGLAVLPGAPLQKLVLNDVGIHIPKAAQLRIGEYVGRDPVFESLVAYTAHVQKLSPFGDLTAGEWHHLALHGANIRADGSVVSRYDPNIGEAYRSAMAAKPVEDIDLAPLWQLVGIPALVIRGEHSDLLSRETVAMMAQRPNTETVEFADCGHAPALIAAEQIAVVSQFLKQK